MSPTASLYRAFINQELHLDLISKHGLDQADELIFSGGSAGALGATANIDWVNQVRTTIANGSVFLTINLAEITRRNNLRAVERRLVHSLLRTIHEQRSTIRGPYPQRYYVLSKPFERRLCC